jgi:hypothetical protein
MFGDLVPELARAFRTVLRLPATDRTAFLADLYRDLPVADFSRDVLSRASRLSTYVLPASIGWSDLGTPERLREWQNRTTAGRQRSAVIAA